MAEQDVTTGTGTSGDEATGHMVVLSRADIEQAVAVVRPLRVIRTLTVPLETDYDWLTEVPVPPVTESLEVPE